MQQTHKQWLLGITVTTWSIFVSMKADKRFISGNHCSSHHREVSFLDTDEQEGGSKPGQSHTVIGQLWSPDHIWRIPGVQKILSVESSGFTLNLAFILVLYRPKHKPNLMFLCFSYEVEEGPGWRTEGRHVLLQETLPQSNSSDYDRGMASLLVWWFYSCASCTSSHGESPS